MLKGGIKMPTIDKTKSQTYNFISENKSIEDIKKQVKIKVLVVNYKKCKF